MSQQSVSISDDNGDKMIVHADGSLLTTTVPEAYKFYFHTIFDEPGVAASNNFLSIFNPTGSGKTVILFQAELGSYSLGVATTGASLTAQRISAASGGTQIAASTVNRFLTTWPNPVTEVRVSNPTVTTTGLPLNAWIPPISDKAGAGATAYTAVPPGSGFVLLPGQGIVFNTSNGDIDQRWKINVIWAEV